MCTFMQSTRTARAVTRRRRKATTFYSSRLPLATTSPRRRLARCQTGSSARVRTNRTCVPRVSRSVPRPPYTCVFIYNSACALMQTCTMTCCLFVYLPTGRASCELSERARERADVEAPARLQRHARRAAVSSPPKTHPNKMWGGGHFPW